MAADARQLLDVLDEPALMVRGGRVIVANAAATALLGARIEGSDVRLAIRANCRSPDGRGFRSGDKVEW